MKNSEIFFDGEKYISSKQAALIGNYTSDYIGQLCRSGKVNARRFGRDWFVSEKSLLNYQHSIAILYPQEPKLVIADAKKIEPSRISRDDWDSILLETSTISRINEEGERPQVSAWKKILVIAGLVLATNLLTWNSPKILNNLSQIKKDTVFALASDIGGWAKRGAALPEPSFIDLPFSVQDLKNSFFSIPQKLASGIQSARSWMKVAASNIKTFYQKLLARKPVENLSVNQKDKPSTLMTRNDLPAQAGHSTLPQPSPYLPADATHQALQAGEGGARGGLSENSSTIKNILLRLSSLESKISSNILGRIDYLKESDLNKINSDILTLVNERINSALLGIEKRIPPISQNPIVFITSPAKIPDGNLGGQVSSPQQITGITAGFGSFSQ